MRRLRTTLLLLSGAWAFVSALAAVFLYLWSRERYGRGGPIPVSQAGMLLTPMRAILHPVRESLEAFGVAPGRTVLELGPGPGYFSVEAARIVGAEGRLLCLDLQPGMLALLRGRLAEAGVTNARLVAADAQRLPLAAASVDCAFLVTVLGEVPDRVAALRELRRVLRPGGVLAFMESLGDPDYVLEATMRDLCRAVGFQQRSRDRMLLGYRMTFAVPDESR
jgi:SAM-dependent methyltransferase